jgi:stage II sporulation protein D (peptidoglycan lytic transglycosylase)
LATTGADVPAFRRALPPLLGLIVSCVSGSVPSSSPARSPEPAQGSVRPDLPVRIGLVVGAARVTVAGSEGLAVNEPDGSRVTTVPPGETWQVSPVGRQLALSSPGGWVSPPLDALSLQAVDAAAPIRINGRPYRGTADILRDSAGITAVNHLDLEAYLDGVVSAEMGRRTPNEQSALEAQAVVSRTYALRNLGRWRSQGFDLTGGVQDQVYGGVGSETPEGRAAVAATRGLLLTYNGAPAEAFFYSTCGGRTADGVEVFRGAAQPYLRSIADQDERGVAYCSISPRYRWREEWSDRALQATLERNLPPVTGIRREQVTQVSDIRVARRTASGRVGQLAIGLGGPEVRVDGLAIRQVLRPASGELLRSNAFTLTASASGSRVSHLTVDGMGSGHGVGFCQWGAVGRAHAGQGFLQILAAYFPGTRVARRY